MSVGLIGWAAAHFWCDVCARGAPQGLTVLGRASDVVARRSLEFYAAIGQSLPAKGGRS